MANLTPKRLPPTPKTLGKRIKAAEDENAYLRALLGRSRPAVPLQFQPIAATSGAAASCGPHGFEQTSSATSWTTVFAFGGAWTGAAALVLRLYCACSDASTSAVVQVVDMATGMPLETGDGNAWTGTVVAGTTALTPLDVTLMPPTRANGAPVRLGIQVQITAGTGSATTAVAHATA